MDLVRVFTANSSQTVALNIQGTHDDPLFQVDQISQLLGIENVHDILRSFDDDEKTIGPQGSFRDVLFLTEFGVYRLLRMSHTLHAPQFQKWIATVVRDIRLTGKYEADEASRLAQVEAREAREAQRLAEEKNVQLQAKLAGKYAPGQQIYVLMNPADANRNLYKLGRTKDLSKRKSTYGTAMPDGCTIMHTVNCIDAITCEKAVATALEKYRYNGEWYQCDLGIITHAMETAVSAYDGLAHTVDHLEKYNVAEKIAVIFKDIEDQERGGRMVTRVTSPEHRRGGLIDWFTRKVRTPESPQPPPKVREQLPVWIDDEKLSQPQCRKRFRVAHPLEKKENLYDEDSQDSFVHDG